MLWEAVVKKLQVGEYPELLSEFEASLGYDHVLSPYLKLRRNSNTRHANEFQFSLFSLCHIVLIFLESQYWGKGSRGALKYQAML